MVLNTSQSGMARVGTSCATGAKCRKALPQSQKLNGVIRTARAVEMAVRLTDSSTLAFAREDMKLEILPPGQEATRIMPRPIMGEIHQLRAMARRQVKAGSRTSWHSAPSRTDFGLLNTSMKVPGLMPSETPNMTNASTMLMVFMPPAFRVTWIWSMEAAVSGDIRLSVWL